MSFCSKDFRKVFPYGRFNTSITNFKLYPRLNPVNNIVCVETPRQTILLTAPLPLFQNTTYKMTQKEQIAFFSKMGGRIR